MVLYPHESEFVRRIVRRRTLPAFGGGVVVTAEIVTSTLLGTRVVFYLNDQMFVYIGEFRTRRRAGVSHGPVVLVGLLSNKQTCTS